MGERYRTGRKVGRTIYRQVGSGPSDADELVGVMDTPELAATFVEAMNAAADGRLLPADGETHEEWHHTIAASTGYFMQPDTHVIPPRRNREAAESEVTALAEDITDLPELKAILLRRTVTTFPDRSVLTGPWTPAEET